MSDIATPRIVGELTDRAVHFSDTRIDRALIEELGFTATTVATLQRFSERTVCIRASTGHGRPYGIEYVRLCEVRVVVGQHVAGR
jgi:hypothetical protein